MTIIEAIEAFLGEHTGPGALRRSVLLMDHLYQTVDVASAAQFHDFVKLRERRLTRERNREACKLAQRERRLLAKQADIEI